MADTPDTIFDYTVEDIDGRDLNMSKYKDYVIVIVNVASQSEFADRDYEQLQELYEKYADRRFKVVGFPCNQFNSEEPKSNAAIKAFTKRMHVSFDMCAKVDVNGGNAIPLYNFLTSHQNTRGVYANNVSWNFTKFLVDRRGIPRKRYNEDVEPWAMANDIVALLDEC